MRKHAQMSVGDVIKACFHFSSPPPLSLFKVVFFQMNNFELMIVEVAEQKARMKKSSFK